MPPSHGSSDHGHMKKATVSELKNDLSHYLAYVRKGGRVMIFERDAAIAELVPLETARSGDETVERHLERLEQEGLVVPGTGKVPAELLSPPVGEPSGVLDALLEERASGR